MSYYKQTLKVLNWIVKRWPQNTNLVLSILNSINDNQIACKKWLVDELKDVIETLPDIPKEPKILVMAGWYGLVGDMCRTRLKAKVQTVDRDVMCQPVGQQFFPNIKHKWGKMEEWDNFDFDIMFKIFRPRWKVN